jgi:succinoglycan biosynthesis transport protein ExoP
VSDTNLRTTRPADAFSGTEEDGGAPVSPFPVQRLLWFLRRFWWLPVTMLLVGFLGALGYALLQPPTYVSKARMWETVKLRLPEGSMFAEDVQNFVGTQTELLQSAPLRSMAIERLKATGNGAILARGKDGQPLPVTVRVTQASKSAVYTLEATGSQAAYTQAYLNALMEVYLEYKKNIRQEVSGDTVASINQLLERREQELKTEQDTLLAYQRTNNLVVLQQQGAMAGVYLATLQTRLSDLQLKERLLQATSNERAQFAADGGETASLMWAEVPTGTGASAQAAGQSERQTAWKEVELLKMQRERLSRHLKPKHPKIVRLDAEIERSLKLVDIFRNESDNQLTSTRNAMQLEIETTIAAIKEWESNVVTANSRLSEVEQLKVNVANVQGGYDRLKAMLQNVGISRNIEQENLAVLEPANRPKRSYSKETSLATMGGFGGTAIGLSFIVLMGLRDDRFTSLSEVNQKLGHAILGQIPEIENRTPNLPLPPLRENDERHAYAESFRSLRSALVFTTNRSDRPKTILITSAQPDEGKSTIAANLARALALGGARVILLDGDLRKGCLHEAMGLPQAPGLAETLLTPSKIDAVIHRNCLPNLDFVSRGRTTGGSSDLLLGNAFDEILERLKQEFEYILIDSSPVFAADDAATLAPKVDATLFVVRRCFSRARPAYEAMELLYQRQARVMGIIFNQVDATSHSYYYYKYGYEYAESTPG